MTAIDPGWEPVNKPWVVDYEGTSLELPPCPDYPFREVDTAVRLKFGETREEMERGFVKRHRDDPRTIRISTERLAPCPPTDPDYFCACARINSLYAEARQFLDKMDEVEGFIAGLPAVQAQKAELYRIQQLQKEAYSQHEFYSSTLRRPGVIIEVFGEKEDRYFILGTVNLVGGSCDDCRPFENNAFVVRAFDTIKHGRLPSDLPEEVRKSWAM